MRDVLTEEHERLLREVIGHAEAAMGLLDAITRDPWTYDPRSSEYLVIMRYLLKLGGKLEDVVNTVNAMLVDKVVPDHA